MEAKDWKLWDGYEIEKWEVPDLEWHVDPLIPKGTVGFMSGQPKAGKSLMALDLCMSMANAHYEDTSWLGRYKCSATNTLYVAREDPARRVKERAMEIQKAAGRDRVPPGSLWFLIRDRFNLMDPTHVIWLENQIQELEIDFLVLDVFNRMIPELDENSAKDMAIAIDVIEKLNREFDLTHLLVDHTRKPAVGQSLFQTPSHFDLRGSGAKYGVADFMISVARTSQKGRLQISCENKDTDEMPQFFVDISPKGDTSREKFTWGGEAASGDRKTVGEKNRQRVLSAVRDAGEEGITNKGVRDETGLSRSTVTDHLGTLAGTGVIRREGENKNTRYFFETDRPRVSLTTFSDD